MTTSKIYNNSYNSTTYSSNRTKEALAKRKADGMKLGRPKKGQAQLLKLDNYRD